MAGKRAFEIDAQGSKARARRAVLYVLGANTCTLGKTECDGPSGMDLVEAGDPPSALKLALLSAGADSATGAPRALDEATLRAALDPEIGRASCRERV